MGGRVIGLGQAAAGDDAVGLVVLERLRDAGPPPGVELFEVADATGVMPLLETKDVVVIVDAVVGHPEVGQVLELDPVALGGRSAGPRPLSTHGVGLVEAIALARVVSDAAISPRIHVVGVTISRPTRYTCGMSLAVMAAVPIAVRTVLSHVAD
jgi:hydrogenase maturation protease